MSCDKSKQRCSSVNDALLDEQNVDKAISKLIMYYGVQHLSLQDYRLTELAFPTETIMKMDIQNCPAYIYFVDAGKIEDRIDLSMLENLTDLRLIGIKKDVMFPGKLNSLVISQDVPNQFKILNDELDCKSMTATGFDAPYLNLVMEGITKDTMLPGKLRSLVIRQATPNQYKILNDRVSCKDASVTNFDVSKVTFNDCETLTFENVKVKSNHLDLSKHTDLKDLILKNFHYDTMLPGKLNSLVFSQATPNQFNILNNRVSCKDVSATNFDVSNDIFNECETLTLQNKVANSYLLDISKYRNLKNLILNNIQNNILIPSQLNKLIINQDQYLQCEVYNRTIRCKEINITNFNLNNVQFESCSNISLVNCTADHLSLTNLATDQLQIAACEFKVLDYSESNCLIVDELMLLNNKVDKLILPNILQKLIWSTYFIDELVFPVASSIQQIEIKFCPQIIYSTYGGLGNLDKLNLYKFNNLQQLSLQNITKDIMVPNCQMNSLIITQILPLQFKILNTKVNCKDISITNFELSNVTFNDCETLTLQTDTVLDYMMNLSSHVNLKCLILNNIQNNIMLPDEFQSLVLTQEQLLWQVLNGSISCRDINIQNFSIINIELRDCCSILLTNCLIDHLSLKNLLVGQLKIQFMECEFKVLDYSESNCLSVDELMLLDNKVDKLILPIIVEKLFWSTYLINEIVFPTYDSIKSITVYLYPGILQSQNTKIITNEKIDFSVFTNLEDVIFRNIKSDIMLPNRLINLSLSQTQQYKFKILNQQISCYHIQLENFKFDNIDFRNCESLEIWNCHIENLYLQNSNMDMNIRNTSIGICKFQEEIDIEQFLKGCQYNCQQVLYTNNKGNGMIYKVNMRKCFKSYNSVILVTKINYINKNINTLLDE